MSGGVTAGWEQVPVAITALRARLIRVLERLQPHQWRHASRCELWTVHDVLRHLRDGCRLHAAQLRTAGASVLAPGFDPRQTPQQWLEESANEAPEETARRLRTSFAEEAAALDARMAGERNQIVVGPYGPAHWTVLTTHVFWDAWLHARDVTTALGWDDDSSPVEEEVVAAYALLIASVPATRAGLGFTATVDLVGDDGRHHIATVRPGRVSLRTGDVPAADADLGGEVRPVVDALAGRGAPVKTVLRGDPVALEPLTWLRPNLAGPSRSAPPSET